jgi:hypothetical protein
MWGTNWINICSCIINYKSVNCLRYTSTHCQSLLITWYESDWWCKSLRYCRSAMSELSHCSLKLYEELTCWKHWWHTCAGKLSPANIYSKRHNNDQTQYRITAKFRVISEHRTVIYQLRLLNYSQLNPWITVWFYLFIFLHSTFFLTPSICCLPSCVLIKCGKCTKLTNHLNLVLKMKI